MLFVRENKKLYELFVHPHFKRSAFICRNVSLTRDDWVHTGPFDVCLHVVGENVKEFFFRVASLAFETSVLSELEKGGSKQIGDVVRKYLEKNETCSRS